MVPHFVFINAEEKGIRRKFGYLRWIVKLLEKWQKVIPLQITRYVRYAFSVVHFLHGCCSRVNAQLGI